MARTGAEHGPSGPWRSRPHARSNCVGVRNLGVNALASSAVVLSLAATTLAPRVATAAPTAAHAGDAKADQQRAAQAFAQGQKAFNAGDYRNAGEKFEEAYSITPHPSPLWNAARAWHRAQEFVRAANLYAKYLRVAPAGARDRNHALSSVQELAPKLGLITVTATGVTNVRVDGAELEGDSVYVLPGEHILDGKSDSGTVRLTRVVAAGQSISVALVPEPPAPSAAAKNASAPTQSSTAGGDRSAATGEPHHDGPSPAWFFVSLAATAVAGGITTWSGLDTQHLRSDFDASPSQSKLDEGKSSQLRTNVLIGATAGLGVLTLVTALVVDWKRNPSASPSARLESLFSRRSLVDAPAVRAF